MEQTGVVALMRSLALCLLVLLSSCVYDPWPYVRVGVDFAYDCQSLLISRERCLEKVDTARNRLR